MRVLTVVLDLRGAGKPIAESKDRLSRASEIPTVDVTVDGARSELVGVMGGPVDVGDGSAMALE